MAKRAKNPEAKSSSPATAEPGAPSRTDDVEVPRISPQTSLLASEVVLRGATTFARKAAEKAFLGSKYSKQIAQEAVENRSLVNTIAAYGITKIATKSVPGAILVGGGLVAKALFDKSEARRARKRAEQKNKAQD